MSYYRHESPKAGIKRRGVALEARVGFSSRENIPGNRNNSSKDLEVGAGAVCSENTVAGNKQPRQE